MRFDMAFLRFSLSAYTIDFDICWLWRRLAFIMPEITLPPQQPSMQHFLLYHQIYHRKHIKFRFCSIIILFHFIVNSQGFIGRIFRPYGFGSYLRRTMRLVLPDCSFAQAISSAFCAFSR